MSPIPIGAAGGHRRWPAIEELAVRGRLGAETLHRLATVLDALDIDVPIGLWDTASRTPQPATGHLPETGVLAELAQSANATTPAAPSCSSCAAWGRWPGGSQRAGARRCDPGLEAHRARSRRRRLGLEALLPAWPRTTGN
jgi:hypothetical protein